MSLWLDPPDDDNNSSLTPQPTSVLGRTKVNHWLNSWGLPYLHTKTDSCIVSQLAIPQWPGIAFPPPKDPRIEIKFNCSWMDSPKLFCPLFHENVHQSSKDLSVRQPSTRIPSSSTSFFIHFTSNSPQEVISNGENFCAAPSILFSHHLLPLFLRTTMVGEFIE